jgi:hypothetical protein
MAAVPVLMKTTIMKMTTVLTGRMNKMNQATSRMAIIEIIKKSIKFKEEKHGRSSSNPGSG